MEEKKKQLTKLNEQRSCLLFKKKSPEADDYLVFTLLSQSLVAGESTPSMTNKSLAFIRRNAARSPPQIASPDANETGAGHPCRRRPGSRSTSSLRGAHDNDETVRLGYAGRCARDPGCDHA